MDTRVSIPTLRRRVANAEKTAHAINHAGDFGRTVDECARRSYIARAKEYGIALADPNHVSRGVAIAGLKPKPQRGRPGVRSIFKTCCRKVRRF